MPDHLVYSALYAKMMEEGGEIPTLAIWGTAWLSPGLASGLYAQAPAPAEKPAAPNPDGEFDAERNGRDQTVVIVLVRAENHDAIDEPKIITTAIRRTAMSATSRPYSVTAMADSSRRKRRSMSRLQSNVWPAILAAEAAARKKAPP